MDTSLSGERTGVTVALALPWGAWERGAWCDEGEERGAVTRSSALRVIPPYSDEACPSPAQKPSVAPYCLQGKAHRPLPAVKALPTWCPPAFPASVPPPILMCPVTSAMETCCFPSLSIASAPGLCSLQAPIPQRTPFPVSENLPGSPVKASCPPQGRLPSSHQTWLADGNLPGGPLAPVRTSGRQGSVHPVFPSLAPEPGP